MDRPTDWPIDIAGYRGACLRLKKVQKGAFMMDQETSRIYGLEIFFSRVHATLQPALSVRPSVGWSCFTFFYDFISLTSLLDAPAQMI